VGATSDKGFEGLERLEIELDCATEIVGIAVACFAEVGLGIAVAIGLD